VEKICSGQQSISDQGGVIDKLNPGLENLKQELREIRERIAEVSAGGGATSDNDLEILRKREAEILDSIGSAQSRTMCNPDAYFECVFNIINGATFGSDGSIVKNNYEDGLLAKLLYDVQVPYDATVGKYNILAGTRSDLTATTNTAGQYAQNAVVSVFNTNSGDVFCSGLANNTDSVSKTYCLNLISLVGTLCPNVYLPLFAMTSAPLRVEITLVDNLNKAMALTTGTGATLKLSNCEYVGNFIEVSDEAISLIHQSLGGQPLQFCVPDYRNYQFSSTLNTSTTQVSFPVPSKFSSLRSLYFSVRDKLSGADTFFPFSSVTFNGIIFISVNFLIS
jgi:hypothetical protein